MGLYTTGVHDDLLGLGKKAAARREVKQEAKAAVKEAGGTKKEARQAGRSAVKASSGNTAAGNAIRESPLGTLGSFFGIGTGKRKAAKAGNTGISGGGILSKSAGHTAVAKANDKVTGATDAGASGGGGGGGSSDPAASGGDSGGDAAPDNSKKYMLYGGIGVAVLIVCFVIFKMTNK